MKKREVYLDNMRLAEALAIMTNHISKTNTSHREIISTDDALGRITARAHFANISSPHYHAAAMDGFAIKAESSFGATETRPIQLRLNEEAYYVDTGNPIPSGFDAVVMIEDVLTYEGGIIEIVDPVAPWRHVRPIGEDIITSEMILPAHHLIRPYDMGALLAGGILEVEVFKKPKVVVIPTGSELVQPGTPLKEGQIVEYNSRVLGGLIKEWGGEVTRHEIVKNDVEILKSKILATTKDFDMVVVNAGSSAGSEDFTATVIREIGQVLCHGVAIKPGKPVILGLINNKPVIGLPGYPVSAAITCELFVKPILGYLLGRVSPARQTLKGVLSRKLISPLGKEEFVRVKCGKVGGKMVINPISRGAGVIMSMVRADGILQVPRLSEGIDAGKEVEVSLLRSKEEIEKTVVAVGSHDILVDIIANILTSREPQWSLTSAHVGSLGGIMAIRKGEAHMAGIHLLDENTGEYNESFIKRYLGEMPHVLVNLSFRQQGLLVAPGNPKSINSIQDITRQGVQYINRQRGAGTRLLLDYHLNKLGISPEEINGYQREEFTHLAVAQAILGGSADVGLGVYSAAKTFGLDFIPIGEERYDLLISQELWENPVMETLLTIIKSDSFKEQVKELGGYSTELSGQILYSNLEQPKG